MLKVSFRPISQVIAPKTPQLWGARGDLEPVVADEQEIVRSLFRSSEICLEGGVPAEDVPEYFRWKSGHVQQRVTSTFEFDDCRLVLLDLLLQRSYRFDVGFAAWTGSVRDLTWMACPLTPSNLVELACRYW